MVEKLGRIRASIVAAAIGVAVGLGGAVWASIPDAAGMIHACYKAQNGQVRIVDPSQGQGCGPSEVALQWSQTGPAGKDSTKTVSGAINPNGTSQLANTQFTSSRIGVGHYRLDFPRVCSRSSRTSS